MVSSHKRKQVRVRKRDDAFAERIATAICREVASPDNPYLAERVLCHGYDVLDLIRTRDYLDTLYLLFKGELPAPRSKRLLEVVAMSLMNPGPRHPATRAGMTTAASKTNVNQVLPASLCVLSGEYGGSAEVAAAMWFVRKNRRKNAQDVFDAMGRNTESRSDGRVAPGFGTHFGGRDPMPTKLLDLVVEENLAGRHLAWVAALNGALEEANAGALWAGFAGAAFLDLEFSPETGAGLFQILSLPGILAHSAEYFRQPVTRLPFLDEEHYHVEA